MIFIVGTNDTVHISSGRSRKCRLGSIVTAAGRGIAYELGYKLRKLVLRESNKESMTKSCARILGLVCESYERGILTENNNRFGIEYESDVFRDHTFQNWFIFGVGCYGFLFCS